MQHHPFQRPARTLASVRATPLRLRQQPAALQKRLGPGVAPGEPVLAEQVLVEVLRREPSVALAIQPFHLLQRRVRNRPARPAAQSAVHQAGFPGLLEPPAPATECPLAHAQQLRRLQLAQLCALPAAQHVSKLQHPQTLPLLRPPHPTPQKGGILPDRSRATWTGHFMCWLHSPGIGVAESPSSLYKSDRAIRSYW